MLVQVPMVAEKLTSKDGSHMTDEDTKISKKDKKPTTAQIVAAARWFGGLIDSAPVAEKLAQSVILLAACGSSVALYGDQRNPFAWAILGTCVIGAVVIISDSRRRADAVRAEERKARRDDVINTRVSRR